MTLPYDYSRCLDSECPLRTNCQRWLDREKSERWTPFVGTFRESLEDDDCPQWIPADVRP